MLFPPYVDWRVCMCDIQVAPASWRHKVVGDVDNMERLQQDYEALFLEYKVCTMASPTTVPVRM